jgi:hypothetical protein
MHKKIDFQTLTTNLASQSKTWLTWGLTQAEFIKKLNGINLVWPDKKYFFEK